MKIQLETWGDNLGLRLPHALANRLGLSEGSTVELTEDGNMLVIKKTRTPPPLKELNRQHQGLSLSRRCGGFCQRYTCRA